jgi:hypothetical protein
MSTRTPHIAPLTFFALLSWSAAGTPGCGARASHDTTHPIDGGSATDDAGATTDDGGGLVLDSTIETGPIGSGCSTASQFVYVLAADDTLYSFDPPTLTFATIGKLNCPASFATPFSMAVDRFDHGWTVFTDGNLYRFDVKTAKCTGTGYVPNQGGFSTFGMGFSTDTAGGTSERLYVSGSSGQGLATIDTTSLTLKAIGGYDALSGRAELTGTGDARLFGAFEGTPYVVAGIDKTNAKILSQAPQSAISYPPDSSNFAFAFWGGDFWLFVGPGTSTDVFQYRPSTGTTTKVKTISAEIVGAGVSTCAPTHPK